MTSTVTLSNILTESSGVQETLSSLTVHVAAATSHTTSGSILDSSTNQNPIKVDSSNPIILFIVQASFIIILCRFLGFFLHRIRQPRVISEVIGGIILGPSVFGQIPGFTNNIFPTASIPYLNVVANLGLILFMFLVGLETDLSVFKSNKRASVLISAIGIIIPFGLGAATSIGLYDRFIDSSQVSFGNFLLFISVAMAITAFPVLARILTELKLLQSEIGVTVLAAGVGNDIVGWCLLALAVALVNAGNGITILYIFLTALGWILFLFFLIRPVFIWFCKKTGSFEHGPTQGAMVVTLLLVLTSAWITQVIGIHTIFGAFLVGVMVPHGKFATTLTEKFEDLISTLFIPLYFALSGLSTNLALLNDGAIWGWVVCVIVVAFASKFLSCFAVAKACNYTWRESGAVGSLMSCKGLVELIVLNIGLNAKILNERVFAIFVVMALVTTFITTPLTLAFYPPEYREELAKTRALAARDEKKPSSIKKMDGTILPEDVDYKYRSKLLVTLSFIEHLPSVMSFVKLFQSFPEEIVEQLHVYAGTDSLKRHSKAVTVGSSSLVDNVADENVSIDALRLVELSERTSAVMKASDFEATAKQDPLTNIFKTFATLNMIPVRNHMSIVPYEDMTSSIVSQSQKCSSDLLVIPWNTGPATTFEEPSTPGDPGSGFWGAFDSIFKGTAGFNSAADRYAQYAAFIREVFSKAIKTDAALYLDQGSMSTTFAAGSRKHIFLPFYGGDDDRLALQLVAQICRNPAITATVVRVIADSNATGDSVIPPVAAVTHGETPTSPALSIAPADTIYQPFSPQRQVDSNMADYSTLCHYFGDELVDAPSNHPFKNVPRQHTHSIATQVAMSRIQFGTITTATPLHTVIGEAQKLAHDDAVPLLVVAGRSRKPADISFRDELAQIIKDRTSSASGKTTTANTPLVGPSQPFPNIDDKLGIASSSEVRKCLGNTASAIAAMRINASFLVVQSGSGRLDDRQDVA